jgi:hypothetical protein
MKTQQTLVLTMLFLASACGSNTPVAPTGPLVDDPQMVPAAGPDEVEFLMPETTVAAHSEMMTCAYLEPTTDDLYVKRLTSYQGKFGHHFVLFKTLSRVRPGTVQPCNTGLDMENMIPILSSVNFGLADFPAGLAVRVPANTQLVLQQHIVNTGSRDVVSHDVMHVTKVAASDVKSIAAFYGLSDVNFSIPTHSMQTLTFDCAVPQEMNVLLMGPHMHEWGTSFQATAGPHGGTLMPVLDIPAWKVEMRDNPPAKQFPVDAPLHLVQGDVVRTSCTFINTTDGALEFPKEMCATYGYYYPATDGREWVCGSSGTF